MLIKIKNKAYNFASNIGVELDLLELLYFQFRTKFDAKLYALYSISLQIWCEIEYKAYGLAPNFRRFFLAMMWSLSILLKKEMMKSNS